MRASTASHSIAPGSLDLCANIEGIPRQECVHEISECGPAACTHLDVQGGGGPLAVLAPPLPHGPRQRLHTGQVPALCCVMQRQPAPAVSRPRVGSVAQQSLRGTACKADGGQGRQRTRAGYKPGVQAQRGAPPLLGPQRPPTPPAAQHPAAVAQTAAAAPAQAFHIGAPRPAPRPGDPPCPLLQDQKSGVQPEPSGASQSWVSSRKRVTMSAQPAPAARCSGEQPRASRESTEQPAATSMAAAGGAGGAGQVLLQEGVRGLGKADLARQGARQGARQSRH